MINEPDRITIEGILLDVYLGILPWEARHAQRVMVDITCYLALEGLGDTAGDLDNSVDYAVLSQGLQRTFNGARMALLETLAEKIAAYALAEFAAIRTVQVKATKQVVLPRVGAVSVSLTRVR